jgi:hypothetical protein
MMTMSEKVAPAWVPIAQAAEKLGTTPLNVLMHIKRGLLCGEDDQGVWRVEAQSLAALLHRRSEEAAPVVCQSACSRKTGGCGSCA